MALIKDVIQQRDTARKEKNQAKLSALTTFLGELETIAKRKNFAFITQIKDEDVVATAKKFIQSVDENIEHSKKLVVAHGYLYEERAVYDQFVPSQFSEEELKSLIAAAAPVSIGDAMSYLKKEYNGRYDGRLASKVVKEYLNQ